MRLQGDAAADSLGAVHQGRVVEHEVPLSGRCAVVVDQFHRLLQDALRQIPRIAYGCRAAQESGPRAVERGNAAQAAQHVGQVRAEDAAVGMQLVDHHEAQRAQEARPLGVIGQDAGVQHVGIGDHQTTLRTHRGAQRAGSVAVEGECRQRQVGGL